jgi:hypothetical protein
MQTKRAHGFGVHEPFSETCSAFCGRLHQRHVFLGELMTPKELYHIFGTRRNPQPTTRRAALIQLAQYALIHGYIPWVFAIERILAREEGVRHE